MSCDMTLSDSTRGRCRLAVRFWTAHTDAQWTQPAVNAPPAVLTAVVKVWLRLPRWTPGLVRWQEAAVLYFPRADWRTACCISGVGATPGRIVWHG